MGNYKPNFGVNLKALRKSAGYKTQQDFADAFGRSLDTIQNWEQGKTWPTMDDFLLLCDYFHCDADHLVGRIKERTHDLHFICSATGLSERTAAFFMGNQDIAGSLNWLEPDQIRTLLESLDDAFVETEKAVMIIEDSNPQSWGDAWLQRILLERSSMHFVEVCRRIVTEWCDMKRIVADLSAREEAYKDYLDELEQAKSNQRGSSAFDEQLFRKYLRIIDKQEENDDGKHTED